VRQRRDTGGMAKEKYEGQTDLQLFLLRSGFSQRNFFVDSQCSRLKTVAELTEDNEKSLPYTLEDIAHNARQFIDAGMSPEKAFAILVGKDGFQLLRGLAMTLARQIEKKSKSAKAGSPETASAAPVMRQQTTDDFQVVETTNGGFRVQDLTDDHIGDEWFKTRAEAEDWIKVNAPLGQTNIPSGCRLDWKTGSVAVKAAKSGK
jgi:hypothetical protein